MALSSAARVPTDRLVACELGRDVTVNAGGSWRSRIGVGVIWGIGALLGASLEAEDDGEGGKVKSGGFKGDVSILNPPEDLSRIPEGDLATFGLSAGDTDLV